MDSRVSSLALPQGPQKAGHRQPLLDSPARIRPHLHCRGNRRRRPRTRDTKAGHRYRPVEAIPGHFGASQHDVAIVPRMHALLLAERLWHQRHQLLLAYYLFCKFAVLFDSPYQISHIYLVHMLIMKTEHWRSI